MYLPLDQFDFNILFYINIFFFFYLIITNYFYTLILILIFYYFFIIFPLYNVKLIKSLWIFYLISIYNLVYDIIKQQLGNKVYKYIALLNTIFFMILFSNLLGLIPFNFALTSHIITTFTLGFSIFLGITILGIIIQRNNFIYLFLPTGVPLFLKPFLFLIEIISYISRVFSLSIRLFANIMAGHALLNILSSFGVLLYLKNNLFFYRIFALIPILLVFIITILEVGIAFLQAYVFLVLVCIYFRDVYEVNH